jgi:hypothetical protein
MVSMFAMASVAAAGGNGGGNRQGYGDLKSYVPDTLLSAIQQNPRQSFDVILQGDRKVKAHGWVTKVLADKSGSSDENVGAGDVKRSSGDQRSQLTLTGRQILRLAKRGTVDSIVPNETVKLSGYSPPLSNSQLWPWATGAPVDWPLEPRCRDDRDHRLGHRRQPVGLRQSRDRAGQHGESLAELAR